MKFPTPNGTEINSDEPGMLKVLTWTGYSPEHGEYSATLTRWSVDEDKHIIMFKWISLKSPYQPWNENIANTVSFIPDTHMRAVRKWAREHWNLRYFAGLRLYNGE
jgi:hypothetical protein